MGAAFHHLLADLVGVRAAQLRDGSLLAGLLVAAAGAAGFSAPEAPVVRHLPDDRLTGLLLFEGCHIAAHTFPDRELLLLDVLALATHDSRKAVDVFARRLAPHELRSELRERG